jgi:multimeric flavodoxin WrbA
MKKKLLAIAGSPRKGGNTDLLLEEVLRAAREVGVDTQLLRVSELKISPCTSCGACWESGECVIKDDMQAVYPQLLDSHYIVIASPLYFMGVSAQLKALIDRCQALWARRFILKRELRSSQLNPNDTACGPATYKVVAELARPNSGRAKTAPQDATFSPKGLFISTAALNKDNKIFAGSIQTVKALFYVLEVEYKGEVLAYGLEEKGLVKQRPALLEEVLHTTLRLFES